MVFQFEHSSLDQQEGKSKWDLAPLDFIKLKQVLSKWQVELQDNGWNSLFWNNHDLPRIVSRWGNDKEYREESAKMLATVLHCMKGTPYIYQGEELGMTNVQYKIEDYRDIELLNLYKERLAEGYTEDEIMKSIYAKGRDNARTPMQWDDSYQAGFSTGTPWIKVNPNYTFINAKEQLNRENSVFQYYKTLVKLRKQLDVICFGDYRLLLPEHEKIFAYMRSYKEEKLLVVCNFTEDVVSGDWYQEINPLIEDFQFELKIANYSKDMQPEILRPYEARVYINSEICNG